MNFLINLQEKCSNYPSRLPLKKNVLITLKKTLQEEYFNTLQEECLNYPANNFFKKSVLITLMNTLQDGMF
jgi:hypothetical protein